MPANAGTAPAARNRQRAVCKGRPPASPKTGPPVGAPPVGGAGMPPADRPAVGRDALRRPCGIPLGMSLCPPPILSRPIGRPYSAADWRRHARRAKARRQEPPPPLPPGDCQAETVPPKGGTVPAGAIQCRQSPARTVPLIGGAVPAGSIPCRPSAAPFCPAVQCRLPSGGRPRAAAFARPGASRAAGSGGAIQEP